MTATNVIRLDRRVRVVPSDDELVEQLRHPAYRAGYLDAALVFARKDIAWAASALEEGPARRLLVDRLAEIDRVLGLIKQAGA